MSAPLRFLGLAIIAYVGLRTASNALALEPMPAAPTPAPPTPMLDQPVGTPMPAEVAAMAPPYGPGYGYPYPYGPSQGAMAMPAQAYAMPYPVMPAMLPAPRQSQPYYYPVPYAVQQPAPYQVAAATPPYQAAAETVAPAPETEASYSASVPPIEQWAVAGAAAPFTLGGPQSTPSWGKRVNDGNPIAAAGRQSRWSADAWALVRRPREGVYRLDDPDGGVNPGLAPAGSLGGSQAGLRITYKPTTRLGVHLRASTALLPQGRGGQALSGGEGSLGVSWQPIGGIPIRLLAERRQRLGPALGGGRNAFTLMAEGGVYEQALPFGLVLDGYGQAGVVGARRRDLFADGALTASYAFMPRFAIGAGMWGGIQPGLNRFDVGPRISYRLSPNLRAHLDYRYQVTGNAVPRSGPALTLSGGF